ncbi:MAG: tRNA (guanosine(46)-N7)-methyltransferase TrmB [Peptostreptococcus sp.]|uniref:tRNA (guanosine(46)-N7)-methyltransferase TrmB n=1 Tax=Peptostreptococcus sp. TaxID=1262 RepID=UPI002FCB1321
MRRRKIKGADEKLLSYKHYIVNGMIDQKLPEDESNDSKSLFDNRVAVENEIYNTLIDNYRGNWNNIFKNNNPIHIEVGTGRGQFITTLAEQNPNINYIALEIKEEVLLRAVEKADDLKLSNIAFIWGNVEFFDLYFSDKELSRIYINFCDPWPKKRCAKRRLTYSSFLELYRKKLNDNGDINFKTDNKDLFEFSLNEISSNDWMLRNISLDLANSDFKENITTEYEDKFMNLGQAIYRLEAIDIRRK